MASEQEGGSGYRRGFETQHEELQDVSLSVEGAFPDWLRGRYIANGPGAFEAGDTDLRHWFDALAMLRAFTFDDDGIRYTNRFVRSEDFRFAREQGGVRAMLPGTPADRPAWTRLRQALTDAFQDNPSVGVVRYGDDYLAVTESPWGLRFDPETLETTDRVDLTAGLDCDVTLAHLHRDGDRFLNLGVSYDRGATYTLFERPAAGGDPTPLTRLRFENAPYVHSFALTERYAVVTVNPVGLDTTTLLAGVVTGETFIDAVEPLDKPLRFVVLDRTTGDHVATVAAPPAFVYHHANAYETDGEVVVDCVAYPDERAMTGLTLANLRAGAPDLPPGDLVRYRIPLDGDDPSVRTVHDGPVEFPMIDYARDNGRPYDRLYLAETRGESSLPAALVQVDPDDGTVTRWADSGGYPGEPVFVPAPEDVDDGVLLSVVLDPDADRSVLVCLDAVSMTERARAPLPHRLPYGFHGQFYGPSSPGRSMN